MPAAVCCPLRVQAASLEQELKAAAEEMEKLQQRAAQLEEEVCVFVCVCVWVFVRVCVCVCLERLWGGGHPWL